MEASRILNIVTNKAASPCTGAVNGVLSYTASGRIPLPAAELSTTRGSTPATDAAGLPAHHKVSQWFSVYWNVVIVEDCSLILQEITPRDEQFFDSSVPDVGMFHNGVQQAIAQGTFGTCSNSMFQHLLAHRFEDSKRHLRSTVRWKLTVGCCCKCPTSFATRLYTRRHVLSSRTDGAVDHAGCVISAIQTCNQHNSWAAQQLFPSEAPGPIHF